MSVEKPFEQKRKEHLTQAEANEAIADLKEKMDEIAASIKISGDIINFSQGVTDLVNKIKALCPDYQEYASFHPLVGSSIGPEGCKAIDFPGDLSCRKFIEKEHSDRFRSQNPWRY